jgi:hypothetical protein
MDVEVTLWLVGITCCTWAFNLYWAKRNPVRINH